MFESFKYSIVEDIAQFWIIFGFFGLPIITTVFNLYNLFYQKKKLKPFFELITILVGPFYSYILYAMYMKDNLGADKLPICNEHLLTFEIFAGIAIVGYLIFWIFRSKLNSIFTIFCISAMYTGQILAIAYILQVIPNVRMINAGFAEGFLTCVFPMNYVLITIGAFVQITLNKKSGSKDPEFLKSTAVRFILAILFMAIIAAVIIGILYVYDYPYDSIIRAFTSASEGYLFTGLY